MKHIFQFLGIASIACLTWSCANVDYDEVGNEGKLPNAIYIDGADVAPISKLVVRLVSQLVQQTDYHLMLL